MKRFKRYIVAYEISDFFDLFDPFFGTFLVKKMWSRNDGIK
jgi:hypothetical protein